MTKPNTSKVRLAVVGCGAVAQIHHVPAIAASDRVEAAVLVDADEKRARELAERFGVPEVATDYRELPGQVDGAVVALPNSLHAPVSIELLRRGVHVLVEKPMAMTVAECDAMIDAARAGRAVLAVGLDFRFFDSSLLVRDLLRDGLLGEIRRFDLRQGVIPRWPFATDFLLKKEMAGGGVLADFGVHVLDLLLWWLGDLTATGYRDDALGGVESDCEMTLATASGLTGTGRDQPHAQPAQHLRLRGEPGAAGGGDLGLRPGGPAVDRRQRGGARRPRPAGRRQGAQFGAQLPRRLRPPDRRLRPRHPRPRREPFVSGAEGRRSLALIESCYAQRRPWCSPGRSLPAAAKEQVA